MTKISNKAVFILNILRISMITFMHRTACTNSSSSKLQHGQFFHREQNSTKLLGDQCGKIHIENIILLHVHPVWGFTFNINCWHYSGVIHFTLTQVQRTPSCCNLPQSCYTPSKWSCIHHMNCRILLNIQSPFYKNQLQNWWQNFTEVSNHFSLKCQQKVVSSHSCHNVTTHYFSYTASYFEAKYILDSGFSKPS